MFDVFIAYISIYIGISTTAAAMGKRRTPAAAAEQVEFEDPGILADDSSDEGASEDYSEDEQAAMQGSGSGEDDGECAWRHVRLFRGCTTWM